VTIARREHRSFFVRVLCSTRLESQETELAFIGAVIRDIANRWNAMAGIASSRDIYVLAEIVPGAKEGFLPAGEGKGRGGEAILFGPLNARPRRTWKKIQLVVPRRQHPASLHAKGKAKSQNEEDARACTHA